MSNIVDVQIWHNEKLWDSVDLNLDADYEAPGGMEGVAHLFEEALEALEPGERFTLIAQRL